jgi:glycosyltransferase involved in cell wall biosynthesis
VTTVSIVIRCKDEAAHLAPVLDMVLAQTDAPPFEVVALDSGSRDGTLALLAARPVRVEHLAPERFTYGRALNVGAAHARGAPVVYLSAHCRPLERGWLRALVAPFADAEVAASFGRQVPVPAMNPIEAITTCRIFPSTPPAGVRFSTANGAVRRAAVLARPFDEEIAIAEDHLWAAALAPPARVAYVPEAAVAHSHPMSLRHWGARFYAHGLAGEYARHRLGTRLPWGAPGETAGDVVRSRAGAFARLAATLLRAGELRALAHLPAYALARTVWYARGVRDGAQRYAGAPTSG